MNRKILIKNGYLWDCNREHERKDILICNDIIEKIESDIIQQDATLIDAQGAILTPGFVNAHTHIFFEDAHDKHRFAAMAKQGIHAVHDLGFLIDVPLDECMKLKEAYHTPEYPAMHVSGKYICVEG